MFKLTFQYYNRLDERIEKTVHGDTKDAAYSYAYEIAEQHGFGDFEVVSLYKMVKEMGK